MTTGTAGSDPGLSPDDVVRIRLASQQLRAPLAASPEDALKNLLAVQAQEFSYARWSLAQRTPGATADDVERAVADGRILRTHILRPTWHFVHRDDLPWLRALSAPRLHQANGGMYRRTGIDAATAGRSGEILAAAVAGARHRTREQLAAELQRAGFPAKGLVLAYLIMHAEISGVLVSGTPVRGAGGALRQTYAAFDERVTAAASKQATAAPREQSLAALAMRYFRSRGPATVKDCAHWSGQTMADVWQGLSLVLADDPAALETAVIDGVVFYRGPEDFPRGDAGAGNGVVNHSSRIDLVQCYDEYIMGYSASRGYLGGVAPALPVDDTPMHVVLLDGAMAGSWRHTFVRPASPDQRCELDVRMAVSSGPSAGGASEAATHGQGTAAAVAQAVERYSGFLGMPTTRI